MPYIYNTPDDQQVMLEAIGCASIEELFESIPESLCIYPRQWVKWNSQPILRD